MIFKFKSVRLHMWVEQFVHQQIEENLIYYEPLIKNFYILCQLCAYLQNYWIQICQWVQQHFQQQLIKFLMVLQQLRVALLPILQEIQEETAFVLFYSEQAMKKQKMMFDMMAEFTQTTIGKQVKMDFYLQQTAHLFHSPLNYFMF
ncbi:Hypothetical_protein [Hexamita inflata]|uniref:Hypothetical_protein n=1 Tax=Hexamita inflata TaxID=28002 RepID=A0AA86Q0X5_9EUKA|nr:Hypothetical protein HINF_LOCUS30999 [Hexamita inflata]